MQPVIHLEDSRPRKALAERYTNPAFFGYHWRTSVGGMDAGRTWRGKLRHAGLALMAVALVVGTGCNLGRSKADQAPDAIQRGLQAQGAGRLDEAANAYQEALDLDPRNKVALYDLGVVYELTGRPVAAENQYRLALSVDPDFVLPLFNLAILRTAAGSTQESIELYRRAIAVQPDYAEAHLNLGFALLSVGEEQEGARELQRAVQLKPALASRIPPPPAPAPAGQPSSTSGAEATASPTP